MNEKSKALTLSAFTLMLVGATAVTSVQAHDLSAPISKSELSMLSISPQSVPVGNHDHNWLGGDHDHPAAVRVAGSHPAQFDV